jgi:SAM-dependent methyltransferase
MNTLQIRMLKLLVHTVGRLSEGIRIAREHGMISGKMIDYVYRNEPSGRWLIGKMLDRVYLSNEGWRAVRARKRHLEALLERAIRRRLAERGRVLILDVASGQARYLQETLLKFRSERVEAVCWDLDERWLEEGHESAAAQGLRSILYDRGDAFDPAAYRRLPRRPDVVVASGFYDWIHDDDRVRESLGLVSAALADRGAFVFTLQTGHADVRLANDIFRGLDGAALAIKLRSAATVHASARRAGFDIEQVCRDPWGYHAVTLATKR